VRAQRQFVLRCFDSQDSTIYRPKFIFPEKVTAVNPGDSFTWVLTWDMAEKFLEELTQTKLVDSGYNVITKITLYDEYSDRILGSHDIPLRVIANKREILRLLDAKKN